MTSSDQVSNRTIQTYSGEMFDVFQPDESLIRLEDIAHALSMLCRYGGHSRYFYSVAEHSLLMSRYFKAQDRNHLARVALLHDATEAYMGDLVRPMKLQMQHYQDVEAILQSVIMSRFGLPTQVHVDVKDADLRICNDERMVLMLPRPWVIDHLEPLGVNVTGMAPVNAKEAWLQQFWRLFGE